LVTNIEGIDANLEKKPVKVSHFFYTTKVDYGYDGKLVEYLISRVGFSHDELDKVNDSEYLFTPYTRILKLIFEDYCNGENSCKKICSDLSMRHGISFERVKQELLLLCKLRLLFFVDSVEEGRRTNETISRKNIASGFPMEVLYTYISKKFGIPYMFSPSKFTFVITDTCNAYCKTCYRGDLKGKNSATHHQELTTLEVCDVLDELAQIGVDRIKFLGGEPFYRKDIFDILEYAHSKNMMTEISSNGILLANRSYINKLKKMQPELFTLQISIDGLEKSHNSQRTGAEFSKVIEAMNALQAEGLSFVTNTIVSKTNAHDVDSLIKLLSQYEITSRFQIMKACGSGFDHKKLIPTPTEKLAIINRIDEASKKYNPRVTNAITFHPFVNGELSLKASTRSKYHRCRAGTYSMAMSPQGYALPCEFLEPVTKLYGANVREEKILDIWHKSDVFKDIRYVEIEGKCTLCDYSHFCEMGCFAETYALTENISSSDPTCWYDPCKDDDAVFFPSDNDFFYGISDE